MHRRISAVALVLLAIALAATGCSSSSKSEDSLDRSGTVSSAPAALAEGSYGYTANTAIDQESDSDAGGSVDVTDRMIIQTANLGLEVADTEVAVATITAMVEGSGGYLSSSNLWYSDEDLRASLTLRVPAESLDSIMSGLRDIAIKVESESTSGEDVTEEYVDIESQLRNLEAAESELLELLSEARESGGDAEDVLAIYREITSIRSDIESLKGRQTYLENMTALATIYVSIWPEDAPTSVVEEAWKPLVTISRAARSLLNGLQGLADVLIYVIILSPIVLIPVGVVWLLVRSLKRKKNKAKANEDKTGDTGKGADA